MILNYWPSFFRAKLGEDGMLPRSYCCIDTETTGFHFDQDLVTEWGHVLVVDGVITDRLSLVIDWTDRRLGPQHQDVATSVGDFVLQRADGPFAYQLAVVVDDADQQVSHVVRGEDLVDNTARQVVLQRLLGLPTPHYLHTPLVLAADGEKLSKQNGATAIETRQPLAALLHAAGALGLPGHAGPVGDALASWVGAWRDLYNPGP